MDDSQDDSATMAAAMGFSSFGTQNPNKRRKFNPKADSFIATNSPSTSISALSHHRHSGNTVATTGANTIPLGIRRQNMDEIDLDGDEDKHQGQIATGRVVQQTTTDEPGGNSEPQYLDASRPSAPAVPDAPSDDFQSKIDAIIGSSTDTHTSPQPSSSVPSGSRHSARGGRRGGWRGGSHNARAHGGADTNWWDDYYDPASIINPWEALEKVHDLKPLESWPTWEEARAAQH